MTVIFAETAQRITCTYAPDRPPAQTDTVRRGMCVEVRDPGGPLRHVFADGDALLDDLACARPDCAADVRAVLEEPVPGRHPDTDQLLSERAAPDLELVWSRYWQSVVVGSPEQVVRDLRTLYSVEVRPATALPVAPVSVPWDTADPEAGAARLDEAIEHLRGRVALPREGAPREPCVVVLEAGYAGAFFHELVGHPLEADAVTGRSSYLACRRGDQVAPDWLDVSDGAAAGGQGFTARVDDEGTPVRTTRMLAAGRVSDPLSDRSSAAALGGRASGHGRRLDYRHCALPRMRHTVASVAPDIDPQAVTVDASGHARLRLRGLQLRWMNLLSGDFEFGVIEALLESDSGPAMRRVGPLLMSGNGLEVLAALRPGGTQVVAGGAKATKGCGKLDQFPLPVSFANSTVWLPAEAVRIHAG